MILKELQRHRKLIAFDLVVEDLKQYYSPGDGEQEKSHTNAYNEIQSFFERNGFEHRQGSVYISREKLSDADIIFLTKQLAHEKPWFYQCVDDIDVADLGEVFSLKALVKNFSLLAKAEALSAVDKAIIKNLAKKRPLEDTLADITKQTKKILSQKEKVEKNSIRNIERE